jgi:hypothetical protein
VAVVGAFDPSTATLADSSPTSFDPSTAQLADDTDPKPLTVGSAIKGAGDVALTGALNIIPAAVNSAIDLGSRITGNGPNKDTIPEAQLGDSGRNLIQNVLKPRTANGLDVSDEELRGVLDPSGTIPIEKLRAAYKLEGAKSTAQLLKDSGTTAGDIVGNAIDVGGDVANIVPAAGVVKSAGSAAAGLTRTLARGAGTDAAAAMQKRIADAAASGTTLTAGQASGSPVLQYAEGASSKLWGGGPIKKTAAAQSEALGNSVDNIVNNLAPSADVSPTGAGNAINAGATATKTNMRAAEKAAYDKVDSLVPPDTKISIQNTLSKLDELATPTPGAGSTTGTLVSPKIAAMRKSLAADTATSDGQLLAIPGDGQLPYDAVKQLRSAVGANIDHSFAPADPATNGAFKQVYAALSNDMEAGASAVSPEARQAAADASSLYKANSARREFLDTVVDKAGGPEAVYQAATNGTKQGATKIGGVISALDPGQQNLVRATVLDRLGRALPGQQNAAGNAFNSSTFLSNWSKLDPAAKDALFGASGAPKTLRASLDSLAETMSNIRSGTKLQNFSGTAEAAGHAGGLIAAFEGVKHIMNSPHPIKVGAAVAAGLVANNLLARALVNPRTAQWLAMTTKLKSASLLPNAVNQLSHMGKIDPDARDLAAALRGQDGGTQ